MKELDCWSGSSGWTFQVIATIDIRKGPSCFVSSGTEAHRIGPKIGQKAYFLLSFLYDYVCKVCI